VKVRYRHNGAPALLRGKADGCDVVFDAPERAVTPGQAAVFYGDGREFASDECLGGGWIE
jgi:tRNA-specific 2-thiouridylase